MFQRVDEILKELEIEYELVNHEPALTIEMADKFIEGIEGVRTKTMFLTNKKKTEFYLVIMDDGKRLDMEKFKKIVSQKHIKMTSSETLYEKLLLLPGIVSPFGLLNNENDDIRVFFDEEIMRESRLSFHPNTNEKTIFIKTTDVIKYLEAIGYEANIITL